MDTLVHAAVQGKLPAHEAAKQLVPAITASPDQFMPAVLGTTLGQQPQEARALLDLVLAVLQRSAPGPVQEAVLQALPASFAMASSVLRSSDGVLKMQDILQAGQTCGWIPAGHPALQQAENLVGTLQASLGLPGQPGAGLGSPAAPRPGPKQPEVEDMPVGAVADLCAALKSAGYRPDPYASIDLVAVQPPALPAPEPGRIEAIAHRVLQQCGVTNQVYGSSDTRHGAPASAGPRPQIASAHAGLGYEPAETRRTQPGSASSSAAAGPALKVVHRTSDGKIDLEAMTAQFQQAHSAAYHRVIESNRERRREAMTHGR